MSMHSIYRLTDGLFIGGSISGDDEEFLAMNTPPGCGLMPGAHDPARSRVVDGQVVPYQPPAPAATEETAHDWSDELWAWVPRRLAPGLAADARARRDQLLAATDWIVIRAAEDGKPVDAEWLAYRAALRDVTKQASFPDDIRWPERPDQTTQQPSGRKT
jgi:hypothetical protein